MEEFVSTPEPGTPRSWGSACWCSLTAAAASFRVSPVTTRTRSAQHRLARNGFGVAAFLIGEFSLLVGPETLQNLQRSDLADVSSMPHCVPEVLGVPLFVHADQLAGVAFEKILEKAEFGEVATLLDLIAHAVDDGCGEFAGQAEDDDFWMAERVHHSDGINESRSLRHPLHW